jgi:Domain of unknown function (DUF309)
MSRRAAPPPPGEESPEGRPAVEEFVRRGVALYNAGRYWEAHEALEVVWRRSAPTERSLWQGLIQAAAALLHRERGNRHGVVVTGGAAVVKLAAGAPPDFPVETARFGRALARCLESGGPIPPMVFNRAPASRRAERQAKDA